MKPISMLGVAAMALVLSGCGGGGGGGRETSARTFSVPIVWAERTRTLEGPASASSATVTLAQAGANGQDISAFAERGTGPAARTTVATSTAGVVPGAYTMTVRFTTGTGGSGDLVASASASVRVGNDGTLLNSDGGPLTGVTNVSAISTVTVEPGQRVPVLQTQPLRVAVRNTAGNLIAVPEGAIRATISSGTAAQILDGQIKGVTPGMVTVSASVDGVASEGAMISVARREAEVQRIPMPATALVYPPAVGRLFVGTGQPVYGYGQEILMVNPQNAAVGPRVAVGVNVQDLAITADVTRGYAVTDNSTKIRVVNLQNGAALGEIVPGTDIQSIAVSPTDPTMLAAATYTGGLRLYRDGVPLAAPAGVEDITGPVVFNAAGTSVYATRPAGVVRVETTTSGLGAITAGSVAGNPIAVRGNRVYLASGAILDATSLASVGQLPLEAEVPVAGIAVSPSGERAFVLTGSSQLGALPPTVLVYDTASLQRIEEYAVTLPAGPWFEITATGERSLAFTSVFTPRSDPSLLLVSLNWP